MAALGDDLVIPEGLRTTAVRWEGERARAWLGELPAIVAEVTEAWDLEVGPPFEPGGNVSWVAPCRRRGDRASGLSLVLKVQLPHPESDPEALALAAWDGRGAVRLHAHDVERSTLLLERCHPGTDLHGVPARPDDIEAAFEAGAVIAAQLHVPAPGGVRTLADHAEDWAALLDRRGRPGGLDPAHWRLVVDTIRRQASPVGARILVHGDLNPTNVLSSGRGWLAIDPKPLVGDPAWDVARLVTQLAIPDGRDPVAVTDGRITRAAAILGLAPAAVALGTLVDTVAMATSALAVGDPAASQRHVETATWVVPSLG